MGKVLRNKKMLGFCFILISSVMSCFGQMFLKMANTKEDAFLYFAVVGLILYAAGALLMIISFRFGDLSILHPMLSAGYVFSVFLGIFVLDEQFTFNKLLGICFIILGMLFLGYSSKRAGEQ